jgi:hypothetical protein
MRLIRIVGIGLIALVRLGAAVLGGHLPGHRSGDDLTASTRVDQYSHCTLGLPE